MYQRTEEVLHSIVFLQTVVDFKGVGVVLHILSSERAFLERMIRAPQRADAEALENNGGVTRIAQVGEAIVEAKSVGFELQGVAEEVSNMVDNIAWRCSSIHSGSSREVIPGTSQAIGNVGAGSFKHQIKLGNALMLYGGA